MAQPQAFAVDSDGNVYVVDTGHNRVVKFDRDGEIVAAVGGFGWEREAFDRPQDISVKTMLDIFIADYNNERIERYDRDLNFISSLTVDETQPENLRFGFPAGVDISKHGELFICDNENNRILKLNALGDPVLSFGDFNWGEGRLQAPARIEITADDRVYVSDREANDIVVYDYYGNYLSRFGADKLRQPGGLAWYRSLLLVADSGHDRVAVFDQGQRLVFGWGTKGEKAGAFEAAMDVAVYEQKIYVLDSNNNRIQVFKLSSL
ncbi:MAG: NHL repeat-containing protein [bacterium]